MKFSTKELFINCDHIRSFLRAWSHLLKKSLVENFIFCAVIDNQGFINDVNHSRSEKIDRFPEKLL